eukprot:scaffold8936_cov61-Phaeocystis_antarctica.AAC.2
MRVDPHALPTADPTAPCLQTAPHGAVERTLATSTQRTLAGGVNSNALSTFWLRGECAPTVGMGGSARTRPPQSVFMSCSPQSESSWAWARSRPPTAPPVELLLPMPLPSEGPSLGSLGVTAGCGWGSESLEAVVRRWLL